jgi:hypothetical protein
MHPPRDDGRQGYPAQKRLLTEKELAIDILNEVAKGNF